MNGFLLEEKGENYKSEKENGEEVKPIYKRFTDRYIKYYVFK